MTYTTYQYSHDTSHIGSLGCSTIAVSSLISEHGNSTDRRQQWTSILTMQSDRSSDGALFGLRREDLAHETNSAVLRTCFIKKKKRRESRGHFVPSSSSNLPSYWLAVRLAQGLAIIIVRRTFILFVQLRSRTNSRQLLLRIMTPDFSRACHVTLARVFLQGYMKLDTLSIMGSR